METSFLRVSGVPLDGEREHFLLGVPYTPRGDVRPTEAFALAGGDEEFYVSYFQQPGCAEAEIHADIRSWLRGF